MTNKLERFTQHARTVLQLAQEDAERLNHNYLGTEHLLIGLVREENGSAGKVLRELGAKPERVSELVERMTGAGKRLMGGTKLDLTPRTKQVIEYAVDEARKLGHTYISTEHLLLGLIRQGDGVAIDVFRQLGLTADRIRREVLRAVQHDSNSASSTNPPAKESSTKVIRATQSPTPPLTDQEKHAVDVIAKVLDTRNAEMTAKLEEFAKFLLWQQDQQRSKPE